MPIVQSKYFLCCCLGLLAATFFLFTGCDKGDDADEENKDRVIFVGRINDTTYWKANTYSAVYYRNLNVLYLQGNNGTNGIAVGIAIDPAQPFKTYLLESFGTNYGFIGVNKQPCWSDFNIANTGGSFTLEKLDSGNFSLTGKLAFRGYSEDLATTVLFESDTMQNIPLRVTDTSLYFRNELLPKASIKATVKGVNTAEWAMPDYLFRYRYGCEPVGNYKGKYMVYLISLWGTAPSGKHIIFNFPVQLSPGTYPIMPFLPPYNGCGTHVTASMQMHGLVKNHYYPISGQLNIIQIDTAARKIKATFSMVVRDTTSRQETLEITNGEFELNGFR